MSEILLKMYIDLHVKYRLLLSDVDKTSNIVTDFRKKCLDIKFSENPSGASRVVSMKTDGQI